MKTTKSEKVTMDTIVSETMAKAAEVLKSEKKAKAPKEKKEATPKEKKVTKEVAKRNKVQLIEEVVSNREVKYIYPEDIVDTLTRKSWRQKVRAELRKLEREFLIIKDQSSKEYIKAKKAYDSFAKTVLKTG